MVTTIDIQCFPAVEYFKKIAACSYAELEKYERFQKGTFRNRYIIAGANGLLNLTIPVQGGREQRALIAEVFIDDLSVWRAKHWRSITSAYSKAPFFEFYAEDIKTSLFNPEKKLFDFNLYILNTIIKLLGLNTSLGFTSSYSVAVEGADFRNQIVPKNFQSEGAKWKPKYSQVFEDRVGFQPNLSILDLLFCEGPNAANLIRESISLPS